MTNFRFHAYNRLDFDNPFMNERSFSNWGISKLSFIFKYLQVFVVAYQ